MQMFSVNRLAELFQRDRSTVVRALRGVRRDGGSADRPQYTVGTTSRALEEHFAAKSGKVQIDTALQGRFDDLDAQYRAVQNGPTLTERRKLARAFFASVADMEGAMLADAKRGGEDPRTTELRIAEHTRINVLTLREALGWNSDEVWQEFLKADRVRDGGAA
jgi:hypothetical protein